MKKLLYVDDDKDSLFLMDILARDNGFEVIGVETGNQCLNYVKTFPNTFGLVLLDMNLGIGDTGYIVRKKLLEIDPTLNIIMFSNYSPQAIMDDSVEYWSKVDVGSKELAGRILQELTKEKDCVII